MKFAVGDKVILFDKVETICEVNIDSKTNYVYYAVASSPFPLYRERLFERYNILGPVKKLKSHTWM